MVSHFRVRFPDFAIHTTPVPCPVRGPEGQKPRKSQKPSSSPARHSRRPRRPRRSGSQKLKHSEARLKRTRFRHAACLAATGESGLEIQFFKLVDFDGLRCSRMGFCWLGLGDLNLSNTKSINSLKAGWRPDEEEAPVSATVTSKMIQKRDTHKDKTAKKDCRRAVFACIRLMLRKRQAVIGAPRQRIFDDGVLGSPEYGDQTQRQDSTRAVQHRAPA